VVTVQQAGNEPPVADPVYFKMYTNYSTFIRGAEVRIFDADESVMGTPHAILHVDPDGIAEWRPDVRYVPATGLELKYVLRAVGDNGKFDDTNAQSLWILREERQASTVPSPAPSPAPNHPDEGAELLAAADVMGTTTNFETGELWVRRVPTEEPPGVTTWFGSEPGDFPIPEAKAPRPDAQLLASYGENGLGHRRSLLRRRKGSRGP